MIASALTTFSVVLVAMALFLVIAAATFAVVRRTGVVLSQSNATSSKRLTFVVGAALILGFAVAYATAARATNTQTFAVSGAERWTVGPFLYVAFTLLLLTTAGAAGLRTAISQFLRSTSGGLALVILLTGLGGLLLGTTTGLQTVQGLALLLGFSLFMVVGSSTRPWDEVTTRLFLVVIVVAGMLTVALQIGLGSFPALAVPASAAAIALVKSRAVGRFIRLAACAAGVGSLGLLYFRSADSNDPSAGLQLQMAFAVAMTVIALLPLRLRLITGLLFASGIVWAIATSPLAQITLGGLANDPDLTIAQRGYETQAVWAVVAHSPFTLLFGLGPGATVDLHLSPDSATLLASGRDLFHVPSVHLLTSYVLLKAGLFGLVWMCLIVARLLALTVRELRQPQCAAFAVLLLCLSWCGLAAAIPAATFFFSNPLCALGLGLLIGRSTTRKSQAIISEFSPGTLRGGSMPPRRRMHLRRGRHAAPLQPAGRVGVPEPAQGRESADLPGVPETSMFSNHSRIVQ